MKLGIMQPYLFPYIGYFQLINLVDKFVIFDDVNYIKKGWINRNYILVNGEKRLFTISLKGASQNKLINELDIIDPFENFIKTIHLSYVKAPHYKQTIELINRIIAFEDRNLSKFIINSLQNIAAYIGIETEFLVSSEIIKNNLLQGQEKIIAICETLNASTYINPIGGVNLYKKEDFNCKNIELLFLKTIFKCYTQDVTGFEQGLSIIDVLMHNSAANTKEMLDNFELV